MFGVYLVITWFAAKALAGDCAWIYPQNPHAGPAECRELAFPPRTEDQPFRFVEQVYGLTLDQALSKPAFSGGTTPEAPWALIAGAMQPTRALQAWALRMAAHHLGRMHSYLRGGLGRDFVSRPLEVRISRHTMAMGLLNPPVIDLGGRSALTSEAIYHEYGHHVLEWERAGLMANRAKFPKNRVGYGILEAWANHFAFVLDEEPRFSEYQHSLTSSMEYVYSVDNRCTLISCDQRLFTVDDSYAAVIVFGGLLWDLRNALGGEESLILMLSSLAHLDLEHPLGYREAVDALIRADERLEGGVRVSLIRALAARRGF